MTKTYYGASGSGNPPTGDSDYNHNGAYVSSTGVADATATPSIIPSAGPDQCALRRSGCRCRDPPRRYPLPQTMMMMTE